MFKMSIDLTKIGELVRAGHGSINEGSNGKKYLNATVWLNNDNDQYGNVGSVQVWNKDTNTKDYIGNLKDGVKSDPKKENDDIPF